MLRILRTFPITSARHTASRATPDPVPSPAGSAPRGTTLRQLLREPEAAPGAPAPRQAPPRPPEQPRHRATLWELMHAEGGRVGAGLHPPTGVLSRHKPAAAPGPQGAAHGERLRKSAADLQAVDPASAEAFRRWTRGLQDQAAVLDHPLTETDLELVDAVVAEALRSTAFRRSFTDFLVEHAPGDHHLDGSPRDEGFQRIAGDARTAYACMLEHRLMSGLDQDEARRLLVDALRDPRLGLSRDTLLHERPPTGGPERIWPPLRAYVVLHDAVGSAAQEEAADLAVDAFEQALQGYIDEAEAVARTKAAQAHANGVTERRAPELLEAWDFGGTAPAADGANASLRAGAGT
ncbi:hypothetical protein C8E07_4812 [Paracidovorax citrulli]|nr:hypothetical protein C8E07_4812 [Paracidovorax citrulli]RLJ96109.1 hypothetical protein C8E06_4807 [Paracidovorax citrulli]